MAINWTNRRTRIADWENAYPLALARLDARNLTLGKHSREEALRRIRHYERTGR